MEASKGTKGKSTVDLVLEETERRQDTYYELALPGEPDSPIAPMGMGSNLVIGVIAVVLLALWLLGRFVILPIYV
jgi:hypothetical protein